MEKVAKSIRDRERIERAALKAAEIAKKKGDALVSDSNVKKEFTCPHCGAKCATQSSLSTHFLYGPCIR